MHILRPQAKRGKEKKYSQTQAGTSTEEMEAELSEDHSKKITQTICIPMGKTQQPPSGKSPPIHRETDLTNSNGLQLIEEGKASSNKYKSSETQYPSVTP
ncbi:hypothetical protein JTB14_018045 [Gonioctena quinquepunctata]|nr:hypothetical protein JTB14_018045 [Gonioctena quinquepunctata]